MRPADLTPVPDGTPIVVERVPVTQPFGWTDMLLFFRQRAVAGIELVDADRYRRTVWTGAGPGLLTVTAEGHCLVAALAGGTLPHGDLAERIGRMFDTAADLGAVNRHLGQDRGLAPLLLARPATRIPGHWDPFETAIRAVLGQQVTLAAARLLASRLVERAGAVVDERHPGLGRLFPTAERILAADLGAMGMPGSRVRTLLAVAEASLSDPALFRRGPTVEDTVERLGRIKGVGPWTAHYIALRACREPDAFPASDVGLLRGMAEHGQRPTAAALLARAERWRPYRAYAAHHIWASLV